MRTYGLCFSRLAFTVRASLWVGLGWDAWVWLWQQSAHFVIESVCAWPAGASGARSGLGGGAGGGGRGGVTGRYEKKRIFLLDDLPLLLPGEEATSPRPLAAVACQWSLLRSLLLFRRHDPTDAATQWQSRRKALRLRRRGAADDLDSDATAADPKRLRTHSAGSVTPPSPAMAERVQPWALQVVALPVAGAPPNLKPSLDDSKSLQRSRLPVPVPVTARGTADQVPLPSGDVSVPGVGGPSSTAITATGSACGTSAEATIEYRLNVFCCPLLVIRELEHDGVLDSDADSTLEAVCVALLQEAASHLVSAPPEHGTCAAATVTGSGREHRGAQSIQVVCVPDHACGHDGEPPSRLHSIVEASCQRASGAAQAAPGRSRVIPFIHAPILWRSTEAERPSLRSPLTPHNATSLVRTHIKMACQAAA